MLVMKYNKHHFSNDMHSEEIDVIKFPHAVSQSFLSIFPFLLVETMATAKSAAIYRMKCLTGPLKPATELE
jgi:hypothetical protein